MPSGEQAAATNIESIPIDLEAKWCCYNDDCKFELRITGALIKDSNSSNDREFVANGFRSYVCATDCNSIDITIDEKGNVSAWIV